MKQCWCLAQCLGTIKIQCFNPRCYDEKSVFVFFVFCFVLFWKGVGLICIFAVVLWYGASVDRRNSEHQTLKWYKWMMLKDFTFLTLTWKKKKVNRKQLGIPGQVIKKWCLPWVIVPVSPGLHWVTLDWETVCDGRKAHKVWSLGLVWIPLLSLLTGWLWNQLLNLRKS